MPAKKIRIHELAKELGMTNGELLDLAKAASVAAKGPSSSLQEAYADMLRRRAEREGLTRDEQPEEPKPVKKAAKKKAAKKTAAKKTAAKKTAATKSSAAKKTVSSKKAAASTDDSAETPDAPVADEPAAAAPAAEAPAAKPAPRGPDSLPSKPPPPAPPSPVSKPAAPATPPPAPAPAPASAPETPSGPSAADLVVLAAEGKPIPKTAATKPAPAPEPAPEPPAPEPRRVISSARPSADGTPPPETTTALPADVSATPEAKAPLSPSGKAVPPPPGAAKPLSPSGKPIPPPPGSSRPAPANRGARPGGGGGYNRPGGGGGPRPGGGPGGGPRPGGAGRPGGGRRPPRRTGRRRRRRDQDELQPQLTQYTSSDVPVPEGEIIIERGVSAQEFGPKLNRTSADVLRFLLTNGEMVTATMALADEQMELFALEVGAEILMVEPGQQEEVELQKLFDDADDDEDLEPRAPVITVMGHVDHGKTTLLDRIRGANVVDGEAGGITQHIGAYTVENEHGSVTFLDTPGHAAFTQMRARGADATDIVVLMVAADDGLMPQTIEAINHARAAEVPIVVAVNKIDKPNADPQRVLTQLAEYELVPESWGGDTIVVEMSALNGDGVDEMIEQLQLVAELEELQANPNGRAKGIVIEAQLDKGRGPVATVLVDKGTLKVGDPIVAGGAWGKVRAMINDKGEQIKSAGPSTPVQVLGLSDVPEAGDEFRAAPDNKIAQTVGEARALRLKARHLREDSRVKTGTKLEDIFAQIQAGEKAELNLLLKADVQGSLEAVTGSLRQLDTDEVELSFVHRAVGGITENDITLAEATNATIIGFNVRPDGKARKAADQADVEIRTYEIIYKLLEDIELSMVGMLDPEFEEQVTGEAEVREIFRVPKQGAIAGCMVTSGVITRGSKVRFIRDGTIIWKGAIESLRRFKDDAKEVREGFECGIGLDDFQDLKPGDVIETYEDVAVERTAL
ncbi:translation initiation factor IF-2 [Ilumatobacter coccineus]|uniref:Translation initiation factor IF-2 n=1 Tax=Ilumatobacter coccineus (strain NBRC 103263 / KCTC 29153 / YM16-304) TaxID=1313172 RepID=A0A6C7E108_ILUCY|nr:translation initiation factor IF-2 [Ilumatobacter coccineus]BAN01904.1 translation initiation factor IF-2 [Ilumatobacter coccineus YM16-304]